MCATSSSAPDLTDNPFAAPSTLPCGLPDFSRIRVEHIAPALEAGAAEQREVLSRIAEDDGPATWQSVMQPLLDGSPLLHRVLKVFFHLAGVDGTEEIRALEPRVSATVAELRDAMYLDPRVFARVDQLLADQRSGLQAASLSTEQQHILEVEHQAFRLRGAQLADADRERLAALNQEVSRLQTEFSQAVVADLKAAGVQVREEARLEGLSGEQKESARAAAQEAGKDGWLLTLILPSIQPLLSSLTDRSVREELYRASVERGTRTWELAREIAVVRARIAELLGFEDFASLAVADRSAAVPENVEALLERAVGPARENAAREVERIAERARRDGIEELAPWDIPFYREVLRGEEHGVDASRLREYFPLERVLVDGVFRAAGEVYGLSFQERTDLVPPHPEARIWEVRGEDGDVVGLFIGDFFTRDTKRGGAWMNTLVDQSHHAGTQPVVMNTLNLSRPAPGEAAHVSLDEVDTLFHEFGHALHALLSDVEQAEVAGTSVARDVVEFPSQVNEMWALRDGIVEQYARRLADDAPIPREMLEAVEASRLWGEGLATLEYLAAALLDWRWHRMDVAAAEQVANPRAFEAEQLEAVGAAHPLLVPRYRTGYFNHTFSGGYASGYYSYFWAEVLDADAVAWFEERLAAGAGTREAGREFAAALLSRGGSAAMLDLYRDFRGRDADVEHLLRRRGLL